MGVGSIFLKMLFPWALPGVCGPRTPLLPEMEGRGLRTGYSVTFEAVACGLRP